MLLFGVVGRRGGEVGVCVPQEGCVLLVEKVDGEREEEAQRERYYVVERWIALEQLTVDY